MLIKINDDNTIVTRPSHVFNIQFVPGIRRRPETRHDKVLTIIFYINIKKIKYRGYDE